MLPYTAMHDLFAELSVERMARLEALSRDDFKRIELGKAAEHLVCADLLTQGYRAYLSDQGLPYDVVVDVGGRLLRIQVKSTCFTKMNGRREVYWFKPKRNAGRRRQRRLTKEDCDILAFVALDIRVVAYWPISKLTDAVRLGRPGEVPGTRGRGAGAIDCYPFSTAVGHD